MVKRQKSVCGISANRLIDLFIFACVSTHANLAREQVYLPENKFTCQRTSLLGSGKAVNYLIREPCRNEEIKMLTPNELVERINSTTLSEAIDIFKKEEK
ncbi:hypothetical protein BOVMAS05_11730 [Streptococcus uberis]